MATAEQIQILREQWVNYRQLTAPDEDPGAKEFIASVEGLAPFDACTEIDELRDGISIALGRPPVRNHTWVRQRNCLEGACGLCS